MKPVSLFFAALLCCVLLLSGLASAEPLDGVKLVTFDPPLPMDASWELGETEGEADPGLPEGYSVGDLWKGEQLYFAVFRSDGKGGQEILFTLDANDESPGLNYVEDSYERSGQRYLYFMIINGKSSHGSLYYYNLAENHLELALAEPCSNNMVFLKDAPADFQGLGFLLHGDSILAVDMATAAVDASLSVSIERLGGMPEIEGSFFFGSLKEGERKYTYLTAEEPGRIRFNTIVVNPDDYSVLHKVSCLYDVNDRRIVDIRELDGEF